MLKILQSNNRPKFSTAQIFDGPKFVGLYSDKINFVGIKSDEIKSGKVVVILLLMCVK